MKKLFGNVILMLFCFVFSMNIGSAQTGGSNGGGGKNCIMDATFIVLSFQSSAALTTVNSVAFVEPLNASTKKQFFAIYRRENI
jgi:hypothetical protein